MRKNALILLLAGGLSGLCVTGSQGQNVHYDKVDNDPWNFRNLNINFGLWGFDTDGGKGTAIRQSLQLNFTSLKFGLEARYNFDSAYYFAQPTKKSGLHTSDLTYNPFEGTLLISLKDDSRNKDKKISLRTSTSSDYYNTYTDETYIMVPATDRIIHSLRIGTTQFRNSSKGLVHYRAPNDSFYSYNRNVATVLYLGYDNKSILDDYFKVPDYGKSIQHRSMREFFFDIMVAPSITIDPLWNDSTYDVSKVRKKQVGGRIGYQYVSTRVVGFYTRVEIGVRPGIVPKKSDGPLYMMFTLGANISARLHSGFGRRDNYDDYDYW